MSKWQGFDQRKICPQCGDYQTRVMTTERQSLSSRDVRFSLMRSIAVALVPIIAVLVLYLRQLNVYLLGFCFLGFIGLVIFLAYRSIGNREAAILARQSRKKNLIGYRLYCRNCGHTWEMSTDEWESAGHTERQNFENLPAPLPSDPSSLNESFERIEWKPPDPSRGFFIVIGFLGLFLIVSLLLFGVFWARAHRGEPYAVVINGIVAILALFIYTGLIVIFKPKANKIGLIIVILIALIGLLFAVLIFFLA